MIPAWRCASNCCDFSGRLGTSKHLTLLRLQQHVLKLTEAKAALEDVQQLVHETALYTFTSAQDRRTLNTAHKCLDSLRIRTEAQANTVEEAVKQNQMSLASHLRQETAEAPFSPRWIIDKEKAISSLSNKHDIVPHYDWADRGISQGYPKPVSQDPCRLSWSLPPCLLSFTADLLDLAWLEMMDTTYIQAAMLDVVWEESERYRAVSLPSHSVLFHSIASGCFTRQGACRCVASQFNAWQYHASEGAVCPEGLTVRSPGSWRGGSWVSALLICCFSPSLQSCCDVWLAVLLCKILNSSAHKPPASTELVFTEWILLCFWFCCLLCLLLLFLVRRFFVSSFHSYDSGLRTGPRSSFDSPRRDAFSHALTNSFISTNTVWRPSESYWGEARKKNGRDTIDPPFPVMKKACAVFDLHLSFHCVLVSLPWMLQHSFVFRVNSIILR